MSGDVLAALRADPASAVVALDYDGTLSPVVQRPSDAVPAPGAADALRALAPRVRTLALVTGRPADVVVELGSLTDVPGLVVLGQYGLQRWSDGVADLARAAARRRRPAPASCPGCSRPRAPSSRTRASPSSSTPGPAPTRPVRSSG